MLQDRKSVSVKVALLMSLGYREETVVSKYYLLQKVQILKTSS